MLFEICPQKKNKAISISLSPSHTHTHNSDAESENFLSAALSSTVYIVN